jgi:NAD(P)-dependent dehydrogenase (short-subunit alcohol dehydrogenase family)
VRRDECDLCSERLDSSAIELVERVDVRWFTTPEEVATLGALLASPLTGNVTGSNYVIDGGLVKTM